MKSSSSLFSILFVCVLLFSLVELSLSLNEFEVFRLIAYEDNGQTFGSKINSFNLQGVHFTGDLLRKLAIIHFAEINEENLSNIFGKKIAGILIILPSQINPSKEADIWRVIEEQIVNKGSALPTFFTWENEQIMEFYKKTEAGAFGY